MKRGRLKRAPLVPRRIGCSPDFSTGQGVRLPLAFRVSDVRISFANPSPTKRKIWGVEEQPGEPFIPRAWKHEKIGWIYFVGVDDGHSPIKIGWAEDVGKRMKQLQIGNWKDLVTFGEISGGKLLEHWLHKQIKEHHIRGEWFARTPALMWLRRLEELTHVPDNLVEFKKPELHVVE